MLQDLKFVIDMLLSLVAGFFGVLAFVFNFAFNSGISLSLTDMFQSLFIAAILSASAFLSAAEAEKKGQKRFAHFILGLLMPYLYPLLIHFTLPQAVIRSSDEPKPEELMRESSIKDLTVKLKDRQKDTLSRFAHKETIQTGQAEKQEPSSIIMEAKPADAQKQNTEAVQPEQKNTSETQKYYASVATDSNGNSNGPFILELSDGRLVEALKITDTLPEQIEVEIAAAQPDKPPRRIRMPYSKISKCALKK